MDMSQVRIVYFRDYCKFPVVRYWVRWQGYEANATESHSWAYETPDTLSMWIALERGYGIFPPPRTPELIFPKKRQFWKICQVVTPSMLFRVFLLNVRRCTSCCH